jgi:hypothetical protein
VVCTKAPALDAGPDFKAACADHRLVVVAAEAARFDVGLDLHAVPFFFPIFLFVIVLVRTSLFDFVHKAESGAQKYQRNAECRVRSLERKNHGWTRMDTDRELMNRR